MKYQKRKVQRGGNIIKKAGRAIRKGVKKVRKGVKRVGKAIKKNEPLRRGVMAARRALDFGIRQVPIAGNVYSLGDFGVKAARAGRRGKLKQFMAKEALGGIAEAIAPQAMAAKKAKDASQGVLSAVLEGKGRKPRKIMHKAKRMMVARRVR